MPALTRHAQGKNKQTSNADVQRALLNVCQEAGSKWNDAEPRHWDEAKGLNERPFLYSKKFSPSRGVSQGNETWPLNAFHEVIQGAKCLCIRESITTV